MNSSDIGYERRVRRTYEDVQRATEARQEEEKQRAMQMDKVGRSQTKEAAKYALAG